LPQIPVLAGKFLRGKDVSAAENYASLLAKGTVKIPLGILYSEGNCF
jgi:hypothetical protein